MTSRKGFALIALAALLAGSGCAPREEVLQGQRFDTRVPLAATIPDENGNLVAIDDTGNQNLPISLAAPVNLGTWTNRAGSPSHDLPNLALSANPQLVFSANIGAGNDRRHRISGAPIVVDGRVFTLDSHALVSATGTNGAALWQVDLTPSSDRVGEASGGGVAYGEGRLFAATGFGQVVALDPSSGKRLWEQEIGGVAAASPTVAGGLVYVLTRSGIAYALHADDGRIAYEVSGPGSGQTPAGGAGVAVNGTYAVIPYASGEVQGVLAKSGVQAWESIVTGQRRGRAVATVGGIGGDPVLRGDELYVSNASGRLIAADASSGERKWTATEGALSTPIVAGGSVFVVSDTLELVRLDAETGARIWAIPLPDYTTDKIKRRKDVYGHYGPILAGNRLIVAGSDGVLRSFAPDSGALIGQVALPGGAASDPVVVNGVLYILNQDGQLLAFR